MWLIILWQRKAIILFRLTATWDKSIFLLLSYDLQHYKHKIIEMYAMCFQDVKTKVHNKDSYAICSNFNIIRSVDKYEHLEK